MLRSMRSSLEAPTTSQHQGSAATPFVPT